MKGYCMPFSFKNLSGDIDSWCKVICWEIVMTFAMIHILNLFASKLIPPNVMHFTSNTGNGRITYSKNPKSKLLIQWNTIIKWYITKQPKSGSRIKIIMGKGVSQDIVFTHVIALSDCAIKQVKWLVAMFDAVGLSKIAPPNIGQVIKNAY